MYCRMCGNKLGDTDRYCQSCGTPTGFKEPPAAPAEKTEIKEEIVFNPPYENKPRFAEEPERSEETAGPEKEKNLKEFISDQEIEAAQKAQEDAGAEQQLPKNSEFTWNVYEFPTAKRKTEEIEFNWGTEEPGGQPEPEKEPEQKDTQAAVFEEELFQEIRDDSSRIREQNIDRFFTFSRKNEEFQELLDREYDKIKSRSEPAGQEPPAEEIPGVIDIPESEITPAEPVEEPAEPIEEPAEPIEEPAEPIEEPAEPIEGPEEAIETEEPTEEPAEPIEEPAEEPAPEEPARLAEQAEPQEAPKAEHLSEMAQARVQYFGGELIKDNESIRKSMEEYIQEEKEAEQYTEPPETPEAAEQEQEEDIDRRAESVAAAYAVAAAERPPEPEPADNTAVYAVIPEEAAPQKKSAGQIVLSIIAVILVIEIVILGVRYFAPDSAAAKAIGSAQTGIFKTLTGFTDSITGMFSGDDSKNQTAPPEDNDKNTASSGAIDDDQSAGQTQTDNGTAAQKPPAPDPNPMSDKNALVTSQLGNNSNIQQVKANTALAYVPGKNYGLSDINNSEPITNNIWLAPEGGDPVYYDKSVVGTVIAFDSQWIDYVSGSSKSVLDLLKKDSEAYRKTLGYTKLGKVKETFKLLEIGEIRQGAKGFYVWVHEEISITEKGTTANKAYNWIYYLEPSDGKMQIVNYFKF